jgi:hypothetical protein
VAEVGPTSDSYTIVLDSEPTANVTVTANPDSQTDLGAGTDNSVTVTFTPADWNSAQTVTVTAVDDLVQEGPHASTIIHTAASGDTSYNGMSTSDVVVAIFDDDTRA